MLISIENTGPISKFEIDTEIDFNLLLGENNIGKSYSITLVYCIIKNMLELKDFSKSFSVLLEYGLILNDDPDFIELVNLKTGTKDISEFCSFHFKKVLELSLISMIEDSFKGSFTSLKQLQNDSSDKKPTFSLSSDDGKLTFEIENEHLKVISIPSNDKVTLHTTETKVSKKLKSFPFYFDRDRERKHLSHGEEFMMKVIMPRLISFITDSLSDIEAIHYLPASRSGLYQALSAFGQIVAELSKKRAFLTQKIELPGISEPVSDYFIKLSEISANKKEIENKKVAAIASLIEKNLLNGEVVYNKKTKQLMFKPNGSNLNLELSSTSSMVSEIAPIVTYIRYILSASLTAGKKVFTRTKGRTEPEKLKQIVIIEEPEAHLHPEIQVRLTELFEKLTENDVRMIITTHSNFIFNKMNNIIISNYVSDKKIGFTPENVSAVMFNKTKNGAITTNPEIDSLGVEDHNFIDVTDVLLKEKFDLLEKYNSKDESSYD